MEAFDLDCAASNKFLWQKMLNKLMTICFTIIQYNDDRALNGLFPSKTLYRGIIVIIKTSAESDFLTCMLYKDKY